MADLYKIADEAEQAGAFVPPEGLAFVRQPKPARVKRLQLVEWATPVVAAMLNVVRAFVAVAARADESPTIGGIRQSWLVILTAGAMCRPCTAMTVIRLLILTLFVVALAWDDGGRLTTFVGAVAAFDAALPEA